VALYVSDRIGAVGTRGRASLIDSVIRATQPHHSGTSGAGVVTGGEVTIERSTLADNLSFGVLAGSLGSKVTLVDSVVRGTLPEVLGGIYGHGVAGVDGTYLDLRASKILGNASIGVAFDASGGVVSGCTIEGNAVGLHVQSGSNLLEVPVGTSGGPLDVLVTDDTSFVANVARLGTGTVPLPSSPVQD
jgi:hypothetical protein